MIRIQKFKTVLGVSTAVACYLPGARLFAQLEPGVGTSLLPAAPSGFSDNQPAFPVGDGLGGTLLDGFGLATTLSGNYNSNIAQGQAVQGGGDQDDFTLSLGGSLNYLSRASIWTMGGNYRGSYSQYFKNPDFSGYSQGGGAVANYNGGRFSASMNLSIGFDRGSNRYYSSAFVEQISITSGLSARYLLSRKTSITGSFGQSLSTASGGNFNETQSYNLNTSALWQFSPLTEFGPGIRYTYVSGGSSISRTSLGPTLTVNYKLSQKVSLNSRVGMDFATYNTGESADPSLSESIGLNYQASKLWGLNFSLYNDTQADPSLPGVFTKINSFRVGYHRKVRRISLNLGARYETNHSEVPGSIAFAGRPDRDYIKLDGSLGTAIFGDSTSASLFASYSDQGGGSGDSWEAVQLGFSISRSF